jgi:hypothetical protein
MIVDFDKLKLNFKSISMAGREGFELSFGPSGRNGSKVYTQLLVEGGETELLEQKPPLLSL